VRTLFASITFLTHLSPLTWLPLPESRRRFSKGVS
jgi:hypothetical protein